MVGKTLWIQGIIGAFVATGFPYAPVSAADAQFIAGQGTASAQGCQQCHGTAGEGDEIGYVLKGTLTLKTKGEADRASCRR
jgi:mono/diheme cytochrome c family protein